MENKIVIELEETEAKLIISNLNRLLEINDVLDQSEAYVLDLFRIAFLVEHEDVDWSSSIGLAVMDYSQMRKASELVDIRSINSLISLLQGHNIKHLSEIKEEREEDMKKTALYKLATEGDEK